MNNIFVNNLRLKISFQGSEKRYMSVINDNEETISVALFTKN